MSVKFRCPNCRVSLTAADKYIGRKRTCPKCGKRTYVPSPPPKPTGSKPTMTSAPAAAADYSTAISLGYIDKILNTSLENLHQRNVHLNVHNQDLSNAAYAARAFQANQLGLQDWQKNHILPFPMNSNVNVTNQVGQNTGDQDPEAIEATDAAGGDPNQPSGLKKLLPFALMGLTGLGAGAGGAALTNILWPDTPAPVVAPADDGPEAAAGIKTE